MRRLFIAVPFIVACGATALEVGEVPVEEAGVGADASVGVDAFGSDSSAELDAAPELDATVEASTDASVDADAEAGPPVDTVVQVSAGGSHTCFLSSSGHVKCVGRVWSGAMASANLLGTGSPYVVPTYGCVYGAGRCTFKPVEAAGLSDAVEIAVGWNSACARKANGTVACWGQGEGNTPTTKAGATDVVQVSGGTGTTCVRTSPGAVFCWGVSGFTPTARTWLTDAIDISGPGGTQCGIHLGGQASCGGSVGTDVAGLTDATQVSRGNGHACAIRSNGAVVCWGSNSKGQLGDGSIVDSPTPVAVTVAGVVLPKQIAAGFYRTCALMPSGRVTCWGQDGDVVGIDDALSISAAGSGSDVCVLRLGGRVTCWGLNLDGELGNGNQNPVPGDAPTDVVF